MAPKTRNALEDAVRTNAPNAPAACANCSAFMEISCEDVDECSRGARSRPNDSVAISVSTRRAEGGRLAKLAASMRSVRA
mmetsp:Transcript_7183/g.26262  ORF Transcript_7183/g.26262 Transcript_7183/m.26262 type:complete len:80 (-) Transcript_7183:1007-1246(-)